jgi:ribose transport system permease protein
VTQQTESAFTDVPSTGADAPTAVPTRQAPTAAGRVSRSFRLEAYAVPLVWVGVCALFALLRPGTFATAANAQTILGSQTVLLVLALGLTVVLVSGDFDLSIGATLGFSGMLTAALDVNHRWPVGLAVAVALGAGLLIGLVNAALVVVLGVDAFIATLGLGTLVSGVSYALTNYQIVSGVSPGLVTVVTRRSFGLPLGFFYAIAVAVLAWYCLRYTAAGRRLAFIGANREAARLTGLPVKRLRVTAFVVSGVLAALAGVLLTGTLGSADPNNGAAFLLPAFAAAFLGSTTIRPGSFNPWGTVAAVYFLATGITGLQLMGLAQWIQQIFYGGSLVLAVTFATLAARRQASRR